MGSRMVALLTAGGLAATGASGYFASQAISASGSQSGAVKTVTIDVGTGETGPAGPAGPPGPKGDKGDKGAKGASGSLTCPPGFVKGELVINHPGGHVTIFTCLEG